MLVASKLLFELNPPKLFERNLFSTTLLNAQLEVFVTRATSAAQYVSGLHITDSVLGIPRVSSINAASILKNIGLKASLTCSLRISDRNMITIFQFLSEAVRIGIKGILVLTGDPPCCGPLCSKLKASEIVRTLSSYHINNEIELYLSSPTKIISKVSLERKLGVKPSALVTQSISSISDLRKIADLATPFGINIIPCIMCPSTKNMPSANKIGLDWSSYAENPLEFVVRAARLVHKVLLTSPNSFHDGLNLIKNLSEVDL